MSRLAAWLWCRWDAGAPDRARLPFPVLRAELNLRRVELACLLGLLDDAMEIALGFPGLATLSIIPFEVGAMLLARRLLPRDSSHGASLGVQEGVVLAFFVVALLNTQWAIGEIGATGRLSSGYPLTVFALTLLFVLPPRALAIILAATMASYALVVAALPVPGGEKWVAVMNAAMTNLVSQVAGTLIHAARHTGHRQERLIRAQSEQLSQQNQEMRMVMAFAAHDLKSPLHGLRNLFDLAARRAGSDPALPLRVLAEAVPSLDAMLALVTRLLDAHTAQHGPRLEMVPTDVRVPLAAAAQRIGPLAQSAGVRVLLDLPDRPLHACLEEGAFGQVVDNLLGNAVRFSPAGAPLRVACGVSDGRVMVTVEDRGPGLDTAAQAGLSTPARSAATADGAGAAGSGLGLFIAATLARRLGGELSHRAAVPHGAVFSLSLPLAAA